MSQNFEVCPTTGQVCPARQKVARVKDVIEAGLQAPEASAPSERGLVEATIMRGLDTMQKTVFLARANALLLGRDCLGGCSVADAAIEFALNPTKAPAQKAEIDELKGPLLGKELAVFEENLPKWLKTNAGEWVLIHQEEVGGFFADSPSAIAAGYGQFGNVPFLVQQVVESQPVISLPGRR